MYAHCPGSVFCAVGADGGGCEIAVHADITDEGQTTEVPGIKTTATDKADGDKFIKPDKPATLVDKVCYTNLRLGQEYQISIRQNGIANSDRATASTVALVRALSFVETKSTRTWPSLSST